MPTQSRFTRKQDFKATAETLCLLLVEGETILTQAQIAELFGTQRQAITKHLKNIFDSGELNPDSVSSILELTAQDGKSYKTKVYNLDAILSVGYRVNSKNAAQFRIWANKILKDYLLKGYAINNRMNRLEDSVKSLKSKVKQHPRRKQRGMLFLVRYLTQGTYLF